MQKKHTIFGKVRGLESFPNFKRSSDLVVSFKYLAVLMLSEHNHYKLLVTIKFCKGVNNQVTGNTIFNVLRMAEMETDNNERPLEPPSIKKTEILNNPFDDIVTRDIKHKTVSFCVT